VKQRFLLMFYNFIGVCIIIISVLRWKGLFVGTLSNVVRWSLIGIVVIYLEIMLYQQRKK
jgi:hypothetical protein